jgi:hypothetical protein
MNAKKTPAVRIDYPKHWFMLGTIVWVVGTAVLTYLAYDSVEDSTKLFWVAATFLEAAIMFYLFVLPLFTHHYAGAKGLKLRMGALINETIPYDWIKEVRETSVHWGGVRVGIGVRYASLMEVLFVTSSFTTLVAIRFDKEHNLGRPIKRPVKEIVLSVKSASSFIDLVRQRAGMEKV